MSEVSVFLKPLFRDAYHSQTQMNLTLIDGSWLDTESLTESVVWMMWSIPKPGIMGAICSVSSSLNGLPWRSSGLSYCPNSPELPEVQKE